MFKNKRIAINKLNENIAKEYGFKYPQDVRRTIQADEIIHTLTRHGENSDMVKNGAKAITLQDIAKYQDYADNAETKQFTKDKSNNDVIVSRTKINDSFYIVVEQVRKKQNELSFKTMYWTKKLSFPAPS